VGSVAETRERRKRLLVMHTALHKAQLGDEQEDVFSAGSPSRIGLMNE
jgi:hypothetical protein